MKVIRVFTLPLLLSVFSGLSLLASARQAGEGDGSPAWVNLPSSPLVITEPPNRRVLLLSNTGGEQVTGYRLGCVAEGTKRFRLLSKGAPAKLSLPPIPSAGEQTERAIFSIPDAAATDCRKRRGKVAIVEVTFADGGVWALRPNN